MNEIFLTVTLKDDSGEKYFRTWPSVLRKDLVYVYFWTPGGARGGKIIEVT